MFWECPVLGIAELPKEVEAEILSNFTLFCTYTVYYTALPKKVTIISIGLVKERKKD